MYCDHHFRGTTASWMELSGSSLLKNEKWWIVVVPGLGTSKSRWDKLAMYRCIPLLSFTHTFWEWHFFKSKQQRQQGLWLGIARSHKLKWIVWLLAWDAAASRLDWKLLCGQRNMVGRVRWSQVRSVGKYVCNMTILFMYVYTYVYISYMIYQHHYRKILTSSDAHLKFMRNIPRFCPFSEVYPKESVDPSHLAPFGEPADAFST